VLGPGCEPIKRLRSTRLVDLLIIPYPKLVAEASEWMLTGSSDYLADRARPGYTEIPTVPARGFSTARGNATGRPALHRPRRCFLTH
jgi:hypothetical protein